MNGADVVVVGAGLSGLACARELVRQGLRPVVLEASQRTGGRIGSDFRDGFILDRAFQVLQTWYPEARRQLDFAALDLRPFYPGALVRHGGRFHRVSDVWRRPQAMLEMLRSPVGTLGDKRRLLDLRNRALAGSLADLYGREETSAPRLLRQLGFSDRIIRRFFIPFFAGVFFEPGLEVSSRTFEFIFRAFAAGDTALPARGMQAIPDQLSAALPEGTVELGQHVTAVTPHGVTTADGRHLEASAVVLAADVTATARLLGRAPPPTRGTTCFHYAAERPPFDEPVLVLDLREQLRMGQAGGSKTTPLVLADVRGERVALRVDRLAGQQEIYVKSVPRLLSCARVLAGLTVLGDGTPVFLLDLNQLI